MTTKLKLSAVGERMSSLTGVRAIMKDIIDTLKSGESDFIDLSAGNPVILPEVASMWSDLGKKCINELPYAEIVGRYGSSKGYQPLIEAVLQDFNERNNTSYTEKNIVITPGSQSIFFLGANAFSGIASDGKHRKMIIPSVPDYTGYGGVTLRSDTVTAFKPEIEKIGEHSFKYKLDRDAIVLDENAGCMVLSRPGNPTGNILNQDEMLFLAEKAKTHNIPLFVDCAYAGPYPGLDFETCLPLIDNNVVNCFTLSKAGLPGERLGFAVGPEHIIEVIQSFLTNACIHSSRFGQAIAAEAIKSKQLHKLCAEEIAPFYKHKFEVAFEALNEHLPAKVAWRTHQGQGGIFVWLWFENLPISDWDLYQKLKQEKVIAVPGSTFFPGLGQEWKHAKECLRLSMTATEEHLREAAKRLGKMVREIYP